MAVTKKSLLDLVDIDYKTLAEKHEEQFLSFEKFVFIDDDMGSGKTYNALKQSLIWSSDGIKCGLFFARHQYKDKVFTGCIDNLKKFGMNLDDFINLPKKESMCYYKKEMERFREYPGIQRAMCKSKCNNGCEWYNLLGDIEKTSQPFLTTHNMCVSEAVKIIARKTIAFFDESIEEMFLLTLKSTKKKIGDLISVLKDASIDIRIIEILNNIFNGNYDKLKNIISDISKSELKEIEFDVFSKIYEHLEINTIKFMPDFNVISILFFILNANKTKKIVENPLYNFDIKKHISIKKDTVVFKCKNFDFIETLLKFKQVFFLDATRTPGYMETVLNIPLVHKMNEKVEKDFQLFQIKDHLCGVSGLIQYDVKSKKYFPTFLFNKIFNIVLEILEKHRGEKILFISRKLVQIVLYESLKRIGTRPLLISYVEMREKLESRDVERYDIVLDYYPNKSTNIYKNFTVCVCFGGSFYKPEDMRDEAEILELNPELVKNRQINDLIQGSGRVGRTEKSRQRKCVYVFSSVNLPFNKINFFSDSINSTLFSKEEVEKEKLIERIGKYKRIRTDKIINKKLIKDLINTKNYKLVQEKTKEFTRHWLMRS